MVYSFNFLLKKSINLSILILSCFVVSLSLTVTSLLSKESKSITQAKGVPASS